MSRHVLAHLISIGWVAACGLAIAGQAAAQSNSPNELQPFQNNERGANAGNLVNASPPSDLLRVPMVNTTPGKVSPEADVKNPFANDPKSIERGMKYFVSFNCVGCHAANGGGGMGPALSNASLFKYPTDPGTLFLVIAHGAPLGMPAWGTVLPHNVIWDLVSYIGSISKFPRPAWGDTVSASEHLPGIEQVPAEFKQTSNPWDYTQPFSNGQKPTEHPATTGSAPTGSGQQ